MSKGKRGQISKKNKKEQYKKEKEQIEELGFDFTDNIRGKIYVIIGVLCFILALYLFTLYLTGKGETTSYKSTPQEASISYNKIIVGRSFSVDNGEYLVVYYNLDDDSSIDDAVHTYRNSNKLNLYSVDMSDPINTKYKSEESNTNPTNASEIRINGPTLIKFNDKEVIDYIEGTDDVINYLNK